MDPDFLFDYLIIDRQTLSAPVYIWNISSKQKPEKGSGGSDYEHNYYVVFKAYVVDSVSEICGNSAHDETQAAKKSGQYAIRCRFIPEALPQNTYEIG